MIKNVHLIALLFFSFSLYGQNADTAKKFEIICLKEYYNQEGIIFKENYDPHLDFKNIKKRYTPVLEEVKAAEEIFLKDYGKIINQGIDTKTYYLNFVRQYVGYIDTMGNKIVTILLTDNSNKRKVKRILGPDWKTRVIIHLSDKSPYAWNMVTINLNNNEIILK